MTDSIDTEAPALIGVGAQMIVARAKELGLTWTLRPATATVYSTGNLAAAQFDGDSVSVNMVNLTGSELVQGARLMVMMVPPSGNYIISQANTHVGFGFWASDSKSGSVGPFSAETTILTITNMVFARKRAYKVEFRGDILTTTGTNAAIWRIRRRTGAGFQFGVGVWALRNIQSNDWGSDMIITNDTTADILDNLVLTMEASASSITVNANASQITWLRVTDIGPSDLFPLAVSIA